MEVNLILVILAVVVQFVLGAIWYSVLFGKNWQRIMGMENMSEEDMKKMQKEMTPFYGVEFLMTIFSTYALAYFMGLYNSLYSPIDYMARVEFGLMTALVIFLGFIFPTQVSSVIWGATKKKYWKEQISIMAGMKIVGMFLAVLILAFYII